MRDAVDDENLRRFIKFNTEVVSAIWNEQISRWVVKSRIVGNEQSELLEEQFHYIVNASGFLK